MPKFDPKSRAALDAWQLYETQGCSCITVDRGRVYWVDEYDGTPELLTAELPGAYIGSDGLIRPELKPDVIGALALAVDEMSYDDLYGLLAGTSWPFELQKQPSGSQRIYESVCRAVADGYRRSDDAHSEARRTVH